MLNYHPYLNVIVTISMEPIQRLRFGSSVLYVDELDHLFFEERKSMVMVVRRSIDLFQMLVADPFKKGRHLIQQSQNSMNSCLIEYHNLRQQILAAFVCLKNAKTSIFPISNLIIDEFFQAGTQLIITKMPSVINKLIIQYNKIGQMLSNKQMFFQRILPLAQKISLEELKAVDCELMGIFKSSISTQSSKIIEVLLSKYLRISEISRKQCDLAKKICRLLKAHYDNNQLGALQQIDGILKDIWYLQRRQQKI